MKAQYRSREECEQWKANEALRAVFLPKTQPKDDTFVPFGQLTRKPKVDDTPFVKHLGYSSLGASILVVPFIVFTMLGGSGSQSNTDSARKATEEWCERKAIEAVVPRILIYKPTDDEVLRGHETFMRECMKKQGH